MTSGEGLENVQDVLNALDDFANCTSNGGSPSGAGGGCKAPKIPPLLDALLKRIAITGEPLVPWRRLKPLLLAKLRHAIDKMQDYHPYSELPAINVENVPYRDMRRRVIDALEAFHAAPFTIQRLCELLTEPTRHYRRCDKYLRACEKNLIIVSEVDAFGRKIVDFSKVTDEVDPTMWAAVMANRISPPPMAWPGTIPPAAQRNGSPAVDVQSIRPAAAPLVNGDVFNGCSHATVNGHHDEHLPETDNHLDATPPLQPDAAPPLAPLDHAQPHTDGERYPFTRELMFAMTGEGDASTNSDEAMQPPDENSHTEKQGNTDEADTREAPVEVTVDESVELAGQEAAERSSLGAEEAEKETDIVEARSAAVKRPSPWAEGESGTDAQPALKIAKDEL